MGRITIILLSLLAISIGLNVFFLIGKGIQITNNYHQEQYQNQQQAQIMLGMFMAKGKITWKEYTSKDLSNMNIKSFSEFLNTLSFEQSLFSKKEDGIVYVPILIEPDMKLKK